jgi:hypothetical protein
MALRGVAGQQGELASAPLTETESDSSYRTFVSYKVDAQKRESVFVGGKVAVGQNITAWAKPSFDYAYASPAAYISSQTPTWSPATLLMIPLLAILGGFASVKLEAWRTQ